MKGDSRADEPSPGVTVADPSHSNPLDLLDGLIARVRAGGADAGDAVLFDGASLSATQRLGRREEVVRSESRDIGLRTFIGKRQAIVSSSDTSATAQTELIERALAMARAAPEDPYCGLAAEQLLAAELSDLDLYDDAEPSTEALFERAASAEDAARAVPGVTNSEGASAGWSATTVALVASNGVLGNLHRLAPQRRCRRAGRHRNRDGGRLRPRHCPLRRRPRGRRGDRPRGGASARCGRLHPRKAATAKVPVVYEQRVGASLLRHLAGAIAGPAVARGTSFLRDKMATAIFASRPHRGR